jgi:hypothetical protein
MFFEGFDSHQISDLQRTVPQTLVWSPSSGQAYLQADGSKATVNPPAKIANDINAQAAASLRASFLSDDDDDVVIAPTSSTGTDAGPPQKTEEESAVPLCFQRLLSGRLQVAVLGTGSAEPSKV